MKITIGYFYHDLMNLYGDKGNILTLQKRCQWRDLDVKIKLLSIGDELKTGQVDIYVFGGGQDRSQELISRDLQKKAAVIKQEVEKGVPLLAICGSYQLMGEYYQPFNRPKLSGIRIFPAYTLATEERMIGNIVIGLGHQAVNQLNSKSSDSLMPAQHIVGFENHSGKTFLRDGAIPLGYVESGFGNNGEDQTEGCVYKNAIGCYMHGSLLPKNPILADWLIKRALEVKYNKEITLKPLDDSLETEAHKKAIKKSSKSVDINRCCLFLK